MIHWAVSQQSTPYVIRQIHGSKSHRSNGVQHNMSNITARSTMHSLIDQKQRRFYSTNTAQNNWELVCYIPLCELLKTFIFRVDVMYQFNVFDDSMDISIKLLIVL